MDTLLGPEETDRDRWGPPAADSRMVARSLWSASGRARPSRILSGVGLGWWACLLFEICIVDASIFVAKFFRAHGGCLGIRSR